MNDGSWAEGHNGKYKSAFSIKPVRLLIMQRLLKMEKNFKRAKVLQEY